MKSKVGKFIFVLSFIPYVLCVLGIFDGILEIAMGTTDVSKMIENTFCSIILIPIVPVCLTIQMCYIFRKKRKTMFKCTFIPYIFALLVAFKYSVFGATFLGDTVYYGFDGFFIGLIAVFLYYVMNYPILPICLIFQIVLIILSIKKQKAKKAIQET